MQFLRLLHLAPVAQHHRFTSLGLWFPTLHAIKAARRMGYPNLEPTWEDLILNPFTDAADDGDFSALAQADNEAGGQRVECD